jgi:phosphatidylglycerophosphatase A|tara:strand:+ start:516 stop:1010 length:495 start_codon:yes stop_codon:yes gene_type:complete
MIKQLNILIITMLGIGNSKYAPGSVASFVTCLIYIYFYTIQINILFLIIGVFLIFIFSVYSIDNFKTSFSKIDAKEIVIDEFIGQSIPVLTTYSFIEKNNLDHFILYTFISFLLFRIFDIWKPYPIYIIDENMKNGLGVILDDIVAGVYSIIVLIIIVFFINYV